MNYKIAIHRTEEGISVSVPALPGCWSEGDTVEEAWPTSKTRFANTWPPWSFASCCSAHLLAADQCFWDN